LQATLVNTLLAYELDLQAEKSNAVASEHKLRACMPAHGQQPQHMQ
jgi:hypothetical protein